MPFTMSLNQGTRPFPTLETERLLLRGFASSDVPDVERLAGAREIAETTLTIPHPYPAGTALKWIETHEALWTAGTGLRLAIVEKAPVAALVGSVGLDITPEHRRAEIGYWVGVDTWGRGIATEAARATIQFGFDELGLHRVQAHHFKRNAASGKVMQKLGMRLEGELRGAFLRFDRFEDVLLYGLLAADWRDNRE